MAEEMPDQRPYLRIEAGMHTAAIKRISISADGTLLATGSEDKTARLWSLPEGKLIRSFRLPIGEGNGGKLYAVALSPDGRMLAAGGWDHHWRDPSKPVEMYVYLFDTVTGGLKRRLGPLEEVINDLTFSPDGALLAAGLGSQSGLRLWRVADGLAAPAFVDQDYGQAIYGVAFGVSGDLVVTSLDGLVRRYRLPSPNGTTTAITPAAKVQAPNGERPFDIAVSPDGSALAVGYHDSTAVTLLAAADLSTLPGGGGVDTALARDGNLFSVAWSADGETLYAGGTYDDGSGTKPIIAWSQRGRGPLRALGGLDATVMDLAAYPGSGVAWSSGSPAFGVFAGSGQALMTQASVMADMRGKRSGHFHVSPNGTAVRFGLKKWSEDPWTFDTVRLAMEPALAVPDDFIEPETGRLPVSDWINKIAPALKAKLLPLDAYELSRSLAISPDGQSFWLGTEWSLYRFSAKGELHKRLSVPGVAWGVNLSADGSILIAALGDGTVRWYNAANGAELLSLFVHVPDKRWVAWTPTGYYAASPGGEDLIGWHLNGKTWDDPVTFAPASQFRDRFYRPDIVQLVLKTKDEATAIREANDRARRKTEDEIARKDQPAFVDIIADPRGIKTDQPLLPLSYRLRTPSGREVTKVVALVDGSPAAEGTARGFTAVEGEPGDDRIIEVPIPARDVTITLVAYHGDEEGPPSEVRVTWTGTASTAKQPKLQALLVGISDYDNPALKLRFAHQDALDLAAALRKQAGPFFAPDPEITTLTNAEADANSIVRALKALRAAADDDTYTVVLFAGHGVTTDGEASDFYFVPVDAKPDDEPDVNFVAGGDIQRQLGKMKGKVVLFMDACHAANGVDTSAVDMNGFVNQLTTQQNSIMMYASSQGRELSYEDAQWGNGAFTEALLSILAAPSYYGTDRLLFTPELEQALFERVRDLTKNRQTAVANKSRAVPPFPVAGL